MKKYKKIILLLVLLPMAVMGKDGTPAAIKDTVDPIIELMKIEDYYKSTGDSVFSLGHYVGWSMGYSRHDMDSALILTDTQWVAMSVNGDKLWLRYDSILIVQDSLYCVTVNDSTKVIQVSSPDPLYKHIFMLDLLDTTLYARHIANTITYDTVLNGESLKGIYFEFVEHSPYTSYDILYYPDTYQIKRLQFYIKDVSFPTQKFSVFNIATLDTEFLEYVPEETIFSTARFIKRRNGQFVPVEGYTDYRIINSIDQ